MSTIRLDFVSQDHLVFSADVNEVLAPGSEGILGILPRHAPLMTILGPGEVIVRRAGQEELYFAVSGGWMEVRPDHVTILARTAERAEEIDLARAEAAKAAEAPAGKLDPLAQARVGQQIEMAKELAAPDAPKAAETLSEAGKSSDEAQQQSSPAGDPQKASKAQEKTRQSLEKAADQIAEAKKELAQKAAEQMAAQVPPSQKLADQATPVDPGATGALHSAENQATEATQEVPKLPDLAPQAEQGVAEAMDRAAADLAARVEQLKGDQDLAQAVAEQAAQPKPSDQASPRPTDGGGARKGRLVENQKASPRPLDTAKRDPQGDNRGTVTPGDAEAARRAREEAWFAKLPPEVRAAIRANSQRRPPRGYEERLQRYFKNLD